jgi:hypothetical protein
MKNQSHATGRCIREHASANIESSLGQLLTLGLPDRSVPTSPDVALPMPLASSSHARFVQINNGAQPWVGNDHQQPLTDGPSTFVWHCSECGDGPYGSWQPACVACDHKKCSLCVVEEA